jgi:hypothetical protein
MAHIPYVGEEHADYVAESIKKEVSYMSAVESSSKQLSWVKRIGQSVWDWFEAVGTAQAANRLAQDGHYDLARQLYMQKYTK